MAGRFGRLETPHGVLETPALFPVVNPHIPLLPLSRIQECGAKALITNASILFKDPELRARAETEGVHRLLGFDGPVMTDSGAFQLSRYGDAGVTNAEIVGFQRRIGVDIAVPLDLPTPPDAPAEEAARQWDGTLARIREAKELWDDGPGLLAMPVQGGLHPALRRKAGEAVAALGPGVAPVGAVVPLMESQRYADLVDVVVAAKQGLGPGVPVHLFGAGHPATFPLAAALGCDLFDSASYALYAKERRYMTPTGTLRLDEVRELPCACPVCASRGPGDLDGALLAEHNLRATLAAVREVRQAIRSHALPDLVEMRCRSHPALLAGYRRLLEEHGDWLERNHPNGPEPFHHRGPESALRPEIRRHLRSMARWPLKGHILVTCFPTEAGGGVKRAPPAAAPGSEEQSETRNATPLHSGRRTSRAERGASPRSPGPSFDRVLTLKPLFGPVPPELEESAPAGQALLLEDRESWRAALESLWALMEARPEVRWTIHGPASWEPAWVERLEGRAEVVLRG